MKIPQKILLVPNRFVVELFSDVKSRLKNLGLDVHQYGDASECLADVNGRQNADMILAMHDFPLTRDFLLSMPKLRAAFSFVTGTEGFDEKAATDLGVAVANGQIPENFNSMAEATILLLLAAFYDLRGAEQALRHNLGRAKEFRATMMMGKTIGLVGFGMIANAIVERLSGWKVEILVYAPRVRAPLPPTVTRVELESLLQTSDAIVLLANLNEESRHLLNGERLRMIKPGAILVNTARGGLIDEVELSRVAAEGRFKALALDTFETEPLPLDSPLRLLGNAILTGHDVGHTVETHKALVETAVANIVRVSEGLLPINMRNPKVESLWHERWTEAAGVAQMHDPRAY